VTFKRLTWFILPVLTLLPLTLGLPDLFSTATAASTTAIYDCATQSDISQTECEALVAIYDANPDGDFGSSWLVDGVSPCSWKGGYS
jgi:hypothetical protein